MAKQDPRTGGQGYFPAIYQSALAQTAQDYDSIMGQYKELKDSPLASGQQEKVNFNPVAPRLAQYQQGSDFNYLKDFVNTGGFSDSDIGNLRERAISPIRSVYASAQRGLERQKALQGGYSPNFGAASAKMAREAGYLTSDMATNANAQIAEMVQKGKLAGAQTLAPLEAQQNAQKNQFELANTASQNDFLKFNPQMQLETAKFNNSVDDNSFAKILSTIQGQQSMYGQNPGLLGTIGNQTMQAANIANNFAPVPSGSLSGSATGSTYIDPGNRLQTWSAGTSYPRSF